MAAGVGSSMHVLGTVTRSMTLEGRVSILSGMWTLQSSCRGKGPIAHQEKEWGGWTGHPLPN